MLDIIKSGYRVIGNNTSDGSLNTWYFDTEESANIFAKDAAYHTREPMEVCKLLSVWEIEPLPVIQIIATDLNKTKNKTPPNEIWKR